MTRLLSALRRFLHWFSDEAAVERQQRREDGPEYIADAPMVYIPPSFYDRLHALEAELADIPTFEQLGALYLIPEDTR